MTTRDPFDMSPTRPRMKYARIGLFALASTLVVGASTFALARREPPSPAPVASAPFASPRVGHPRPIPLSKPDAAAARTESSADARAAEPIRTVAELDKYLEAQLLYAQYDPSVAGDVAEEGIGLMNSLVDELGGLDRALEKEREFTAKLQRLTETTPTRPTVEPPEMKRLLSEMQRTTDGTAQAALLSDYLDQMSRAAPEQRGYWLERLRDANIEDHRAQPDAPAGGLGGAAP